MSSGIKNSFHLLWKKMPTLHLLSLEMKILFKMKRSLNEKWIVKSNFAQIYQLSLKLLADS